jgi:hypothetical protein
MKTPMFEHFHKFHKSPRSIRAKMNKVSVIYLFINLSVNLLTSRIGGFLPHMGMKWPAIDFPLQPNGFQA